MGFKVNKSGGNMYEGKFTTNPLGGRCLNNGTYCYVKDFRIPSLIEKYTGEIRLDESILEGRTGTGREIFVCSCNDLFAEGVPSEYIQRIIDTANEVKSNVYLFQTKNPARMWVWEHQFPENSILTTTIETNREMTTHGCLNAPTPQKRAEAFKRITMRKKQLTIEPVMDYDTQTFINLIKLANPDKVAIGCDSKVLCTNCDHVTRYRESSRCPKCGERGFVSAHGLPEPTHNKLNELIIGLNNLEIEVELKSNLGRIR